MITAASPNLSCRSVATVRRSRPNGAPTAAPINIREMVGRSPWARSPKACAELVSVPRVAATTTATSVGIASESNGTASSEKPKPVALCTSEAISTTMMVTQMSTASIDVSISRGRGEEIVEGLATNHESGLTISHEHDCWSGDLVRVGTERIAVRTHDRSGEDVADLQILGDGVADEQISRLAVLAHDGRPAGTVGTDLTGKERFVLAPVEDRTSVVAHAAVHRHVGADARDVLDGADLVEGDRGLGRPGDRPGSAVTWCA